MSSETVALLDALSQGERVRVLEVIDDWNDNIAVSRSDIADSVPAPDGVPLPSGFLTGTIEMPTTRSRGSSGSPSWPDGSTSLKRTKTTRGMAE